jgi:hypothetical protein
MHSATIGRWRSWPRRTKIIAAGLALLLVAGIALAAYLLSSPLRGSGAIQQAPRLEILTAAVAGTSSPEVVCSASVPGGTGVGADLQFIGIEGDTCDVTFTMRAIGRLGPTGARLQGVTWADPALVRIAWMAPGCGSAFLSPATVVTATVRLSVVPGAVTGNFDALPTAGVTAVDAPSYVAASCPVA